VSGPNVQAPAMQNEGGTASVNLSSMGSSKSVPAKDVKSGVASDALKSNGNTALVADADLYDPDQPLWNNEHPEAPCASFAHADTGVWNAESSGYEIEREHSNQVFGADGLQSSKSSVWGKITSKRKSGPGGNTSKTSATSITGNQRSNYDEVATSTAQIKSATANDTSSQSYPRIHGDVDRQSNQTSHKASRTLYVHGISQEINRWEALLSHFQRFGQVIDIYIPSNSEKAFVQFSKREEAEAALKAPDAVMGNRFIKLWWAKRDRIPDEGEGRNAAKFPQLSTAQPSYSNKSVQSTTPRGSSVSSADASGAGIGLKILPATSIKSVPPAPRRQESLELLEELHKKQEILAQKRDEFRRQLEKLAKQVLTVFPRVS
jgi:RNA-binding protein 26